MANGLPEGFSYVDEAEGSLPEGFSFVDEPTKDELYQKQVDIAQSALPESTMGRLAVDIGRGFQNTIQGVQQLKRQGDLNNIKNKAAGKPFKDERGIVRMPSKLDVEYAKDELSVAQKDYDDWVADRSNELALYRASTEGRKWSALAGEMIGGMASLPVPGMGAAKVSGQGVLQGAKELGKVILGEGAIGASAAGLDFVPEGLSRAENMALGFGLSSLFRGGAEGVQGIAPKIRNVISDRKMTKDEAEQFVSEIRAQDIDVSNTIDAVEGLINKKFVDKQLEGMPSGEIEAMSEPMKERLAIFTFMNTEPTRAQLLRDPLAMAEEIKLSSTKPGEAIADRFKDQRESAKRKLQEVTGTQSRDKFGSDLLDTMDSIKKDWLEENDRLYSEATKLSNPDDRIDLSSFTSKIVDNQEEINLSPKATAAISKINRLFEKKLALPEEVKAIDKQMKADFGDNAQGQAFKLMELSKLNNGISAEDSNEIFVKTINKFYKGGTTDDKQALGELREALLTDTIDGVGGDLFIQARTNFREMQEMIDEFPIMKKLGFYKSGEKPNDALSEEKIFEEIVTKSSNKDFDNFMNLLESPRYSDQMEPLKDSLRESVFSYINKQAMSGRYDEFNNPTFVQNKFDKALDKLVEKGGMERLGRVLDKDEIVALNMIKRYGKLLQEPPSRKSDLNPSNTAIQGLTGAIGILSRSPAGRFFLTGMAEGNKLIESMLEKQETARRLAGGNIPGEIAKAQQVMAGQGGPNVLTGVAQSAANVMPTSVGLTRAATASKDREEQKQKALARALQQ
jgi:hypothetical protein